MTPQENPKPNKVDYFAIAMLIVSAGASMQDILPAKYAGIVVALYAILRVYSKWLGSRSQQDAIVEGKDLGEELKQDIAITKSHVATIAVETGVALSK